MSPQTNSCHHSTYHSIKGLDDDAFKEFSKLPQPKNLGSQTSDEINNVINDFHLRNHKITHDSRVMSEYGVGENRIGIESSDSEIIRSITDNEWYVNKMDKLHQGIVTGNMSHAKMSHGFPSQDQLFEYT